jgi:4-amino-4-deoxy-L-arabinose transferase-like glycosyltransferase/DNA-binding beta-propeller fold protein YncE
MSQALNLHLGWRRNVGVWLLILAIGISFVSFRFFASEETYPQGWWLYLSSLVLLVSGGLLLTKGDSWRAEWQTLLPNRTIAIGLILVLGLALLMRLYNFANLPFGIWYDEAEAGLQARRILQEPSYRPVFYAPINVTGHLLALYALALDGFGDNIYSIRLVSVLFGLGGVLAAYLFGQEVRGPRFGLILAFLMAVARWPVNFSRIAMTGIDAPFFEFLSLFFLVRMLRRGRLRDALWAGLSLGFGLMFYTAFRLYGLALLLLIIAACLLGFFDSDWQRWWASLLNNKGWLASLGRLAFIVVIIWLVIMPVVKFALDETDAFWYRTNQISIFTRRDQPDLPRALWESASKHLLMFNFKGDSNGRHNLPGEPMLDPVMAVLGVLGLALALARFRQPANLFFLILFPITMVGGIFSVDFEAPQSLRSIAVIPAVIYFVGLALAALGLEAEEALEPLPRSWLLGAATGLLGLILGLNAYTYFVRQANDFASWNAFSTAETISGRKMAQLGPNYTFYVSPFLANHPTMRFLAPYVVGQRILNLPDALPIREPADHPVGLLIHPDDQRVFEEAQRLYPGAEFEAASSPTVDVTPVVYFVGLQPVNLAAVQGLELRYLSANEAGQVDTPSVSHLPVERALGVNTNWPADLPSMLSQKTGDDATPSDLVAEWTGVLYAPRYGPYSLRLITPGPGLLEIDGNTILEGQGEQLTGLPLAQGNHSIRVQADVAPGQVALSWQPPGQGETLVPSWALYAPPIANHGLLGAYYANDRWAGQPVLQRIDPFLDIYFHFTPLPRPYTVEWTGSLDVPQSGVYRLGLRAVPEAQLEIDGIPLVATTGPDQYTDATLTLQEGLHELRIRFKDNTDRSRIHLYWIPPIGSLQPIPSENLWPPLGRYPVRPTPPAETATVSPLTLNWVATWGGPGNRPGQFLEPRDVAGLSDGSLLVADTVNRRVQLLDPQGRPLNSLTGDPFPFEEPLAVAVNSKDEILILDSTLQWVYRYDSAGNLLDRFGGPTAYLFHPRGMTVLEDDTVALADTGGSRLALFSPDGLSAGSIGGLGNGPGQFNEPTDVLRDAQGTYFVAEAENNRIQRVDAGGSPLSQWAIPDSYGFNGPHLAFGPDGSIFVTESRSRSLFRYAPNGELLDQWQTIGSVNLAAPVGLYFDAKTNRLYVTDVLTHQVHVFEVQADGE